MQITISNFWKRETVVDTAFIDYHSIKSIGMYTFNKFIRNKYSTCVQLNEYHSFEWQTLIDFCKCSSLNSL